MTTPNDQAQGDHSAAPTFCLGSLPMEDGEGLYLCQRDPGHDGKHRWSIEWTDDDE